MYVKLLLPLVVIIITFPLQRLRIIVVSMYMSVSIRLSVCLSVCPLEYLWNHMRDLYQFLSTLSMSVARSSSGMLTIGHIANHREGGDGSVQRERNVIYYCLVGIVVVITCFVTYLSRRSQSGHRKVEFFRLISVMWSSLSVATAPDQNPQSERL